ncbi:MAG: thiamine-phosphate kinase [Chloroflexi bacterium]|nr:MAG: thiamine-phosphate kinase [Chloroflexota bacterium]
MKVSELGEFGLIELLSAVVTWNEADPDLLVGPGDDAAAWRVEAGTVLATTDTLVQDVHFTTKGTWHEIGWKALAINLSDIAAMGGTPQYALVSLSCPGETEVDDMVRLYHGMKDVADRFHVAVAGGNVTRAPVVVITLTVMGRAKPQGVLTRSAAVPGDLLAVTGYLGSSAAGLGMLTRHLRFSAETESFLRRAHLQPWPRVAEGQLLLDAGVRAAIDISDGLMADLDHLCQASGVGALVRADQLPVHPEVSTAFPGEILDLALTGGEDYELLFSGSEEVMGRVRTLLRQPGAKDACPVTVIGEITGKKGLRVIDADGTPLPVTGKGWNHFKKGG